MVFLYTVPRTQMTHILEDLTHTMEGQPPKDVMWVQGVYIYSIYIIYLYIYTHASQLL